MTATTDEPRFGRAMKVTPTTTPLVVARQVRKMLDLVAPNLTVDFEVKGDEVTITVSRGMEGADKVVDRLDAVRESNFSVGSKLYAVEREMRRLVHPAVVDAYRRLAQSVDEEIKAVSS